MTAQPFNFRRTLVTLLGLCFFEFGCAHHHLVTEARFTIDWSPTNHYARICMEKMSEDPRLVQRKVVEGLQKQGFNVEVFGEDSRRESQGSGFILTEQGQVLTCAHVVKNWDVATVWLRGERFDATVTRADTNTDIAILQLTNTTTNRFHPLTLVPDAKLEMGQEVFTIGFPLSEILGKSARLTKGLISSTVGMHDDPKQLQVSAEVQPGNSGCPLLNENGQVIGMIAETLNPRNIYNRTGGSALPQNVNFAIKPAGLIEFLVQAGVTLPATNSAGNTKQSFEQVKDNVVLVRAGKILAGEEELTDLWCAIRYHYFWDLYWRFRDFGLYFYDGRTGKLILKAGRYGDNLSTEDSTIEAACLKAGEKLAPILIQPAAAK